jgi:hypothetical protein
MFGRGLDLSVKKVHNRSCVCVCVCGRVCVAVCVVCGCVWWGDFSSWLTLLLSFSPQPGGR